MKGSPVRVRASAWSICRDFFIGMHLRLAGFSGGRTLVQARLYPRRKSPRLTGMGSELQRPVDEDYLDDLLRRVQLPEIADAWWEVCAPRSVPR